MSLDARKTALLVMDYQPGIVDRPPDPAGQVALAKQAIAVMREHGGHVGYVRVAFTDDELAALPADQPHGPHAAQYGRALHADEPSTQIHDELAPQPEDIVVRKTRVGAFSTTDLHEQLQERGIDTLVLAGISTSGVVLSTVRDGHDRDYALYVLSDASADPGPRGPHVPDHEAPAAPGRHHHARRPAGPAPALETQKARSPGLSLNSGDRIRTCDLRVMSPTSYLTAPPRVA